MGYAALECIEDAIEATKAFLLPIDADRWVPMAIIVFFLSAGTGVGAAPNQVFSGLGGGFDFEIEQPGPPWEWSLSAIPDSVWLLLGAVVIALVVLGLFFGILSSVMQFVLVEALRTERARVRAPFRRYLRAGFSLFLFRAAIFLLFLALPLGLFVFVVVLPAVSGGASAATLLGIGLVALLVGIVLVFIASIVHGLTIAFVVPVMMIEQCGVVAGWRRFWPTLRGNLGEFAIYVLLRWVIATAVGFVAGTVTGILAGVVAVPVVVLAGGIFLGTGGALTFVTIATYALVVLGFILVVTALAAVVQVPLQTFTRYYELLVLGDIDPDYDLVAERREAVRSPDFDAGGEPAPR